MSDTGSESESSTSRAVDGPIETVIQNGINGHAQREYRVEIVKDMAIENMKQKMHHIVNRMSKDVEKEMDLAVEDLFTEMKQIHRKNYELPQLFNDKVTNGTSQPKRVRADGKLPDKSFSPRNSLLTDLLEAKHIKTLHHIFIAMLIILFLNTMVHDFVDTGSINLGLRPITAGFGRFHLAMVLWCCMQTSTFLVYPCFQLWATTHKRLTANSIARKSWDWAGVFTFFIYQWVFMIASLAGLLWADLQPASAVAYLMEMTRFLMKSHAFIRSNAPKVLTNDVNSASFPPGIHRALPSFSTYVYFLFVPTLVYRDEYPRTRQIRWFVVARHCLEVIAVVFYISFILERYLTPMFENFGKAAISPGTFVLTIFSSMLPGTLFLLVFFYSSLHASMNIAAELTCFADRMFYRDWWNESTFAGYIRSWNLVVHDWLYTYVYKDFMEYFFCYCRPVAMVAVITVSAVFHEIILSFTFRFFYPVMFVQFEFLGLMLMLVTKRMGRDVGNLVLWFSLAVGNGILASLYYMEYFARRNCPDVGNSILDYVVPVSWSCNGITRVSNWTITAPWNLP
ncbi:sterol O-acyltransferase 1-like [Anopheles maculipalpis]|uniref:sterol O-acyltransferase 1-like n=1 Tax=Anopheles maculipalpis TaxID=1496333 RepID=UPI00215919C4|nr:sterol O-acyltransferase 1-like [Anopheles maculipalpis]